MYIDNEQFIAGTTLKDEMEIEHNNMALHSCHDVQAIINNRQHLVATLNCDLQNFICTEQTHSANFHKSHISRSRTRSRANGYSGEEYRRALYTLSLTYYYVVLQQIACPLFFIML